MRRRWMTLWMLIAAALLCSLGSRSGNAQGTHIHDFPRYLIMRESFPDIPGTARTATAYDTDRVFGLDVVLATQASTTLHFGQNDTDLDFLGAGSPTQRDVVLTANEQDQFGGGRFYIDGSVLGLFASGLNQPPVILGAPGWNSLVPKMDEEHAVVNLQQGASRFAYSFDLSSQQFTPFPILPGFSTATGWDLQHGAYLSVQEGSPGVALAYHPNLARPPVRVDLFSPGTVFRFAGLTEIQDSPAILASVNSATSSNPRTLTYRIRPDLTWTLPQPTSSLILERANRSGLAGGFRINVGGPQAVLFDPAVNVVAPLDTLVDLGDRRVQSFGGINPENRIALNVLDSQNRSGVLLLAPAPPCLPPLQPKDERAIHVDQRSVVLGWRLVEPPVANEVRVERRDPGGSFREIARLPAGTVTFVDTNLTPDTAYDYHVIAVNACGDSPPSSLLRVTTACEKPNPPRNLRLTDVTFDPLAFHSHRRVRMQWDTLIQPPAADGIRVELKWASNPAAGPDYRPVALLPADAVSFTHSPLQLSTTEAYEYRVVAFNKCGDSEPSLPIRVVIDPPTLNELIEAVERTPDFKNDGTRQSLLQKLKSASRLLGFGDRAGAVIRLNEFEDHLHKKEGKQISPRTAARLSWLAALVRVAIEASGG